MPWRPHGTMPQPWCIWLEAYLGCNRSLCSRLWRVFWKHATPEQRYLLIEADIRLHLDRHQSTPALAAWLRACPPSALFAWTEMVRPSAHGHPRERCVVALEERILQSTRANHWLV